MKMEKTLRIIHELAVSACILAVGLLGFTVCALPTLAGGVAGDVMALIMFAIGILLCGCGLFDVIETRKDEAEGA